MRRHKHTRASILYVKNEVSTKDEQIRMLKQQVFALEDLKTPVRNVNRYECDVDDSST